MENITSEQELKQLLEEGRITDDEYDELLNAMKARPADSEATLHITDKSKSKLGKIAFILTLTGITLPFLIYYLIQSSAPPNVGAAIGPWFFLGLAIELIALTMGIKSWSNNYGKAASIASGTIIILAIVLIS